MSRGFLARSRRRADSVLALTPMALLALGASATLGACRGATDAASEHDARVALNVNVGAAPISTISVEVTAEDIATPLVFNLTIENGTASGVITVPAGLDRTIRVRAFDEDGGETHRGEATVDLQAGANPMLRLTLGPLGSDLPIEVIFTDFIITVSPAAMEWCIGDPFPVDFTATVTSVDGTPMAVTVRWASLNPAIASVDEDGTVTPRNRGATMIVATYGAVGAASPVGVAGCAGQPPR